MKFYVPCEAIRYLKDEDFEWLMPADFCVGRQSITLYQYSNGWIIEADESFNTFFALITGRKLPYITDQEYRQFLLDKVAYLGRERTQNIWKAWCAFETTHDK